MPDRPSRVALVTLTQPGCGLAERLAGVCRIELAGQPASAPSPGTAGRSGRAAGSVHHYHFVRPAAACQGRPGPPPGARPFTSLRELAPRLMAAYDLIIFVAPTGVAVRAVAPHLRGKGRDPAVLVVDEPGRFVVSLLGAHGKGANRWTLALARALGAVPVITTALEAHGLPPLEATGAEYGWRLEGKSPAVARVAGAILNGERVGAYLDPGLPPLPPELDLRLERVDALEDLAGRGFAAALVVSDRELPGAEVHGADWLVFRPPTLAVGVGCERGATGEEIARGYHQVLRRYGLARGSVAVLASVDRKQDEEGLLAFAAGEGLPLRFFTPGELGRVPGLSRPSEVVQRVTGAPGVCEPAALLAAGGGALVGSKLVAGRVTVAVARNPRGIRWEGAESPGQGS